MKRKETTSNKFEIGLIYDSKRFLNEPMKKRYLDNFPQKKKEIPSGFSYTLVSLFCECFRSERTFFQGFFGALLNFFVLSYKKAKKGIFVLFVSISTFTKVFEVD